MSLDVPVGWRTMQVGEALSQRRGASVRKLQTSEYLPFGPLPIVDQGAKFICGYTDDLAAAYPYDLPVIVFGDHTRALKYVDFPFAIGADGTQCLHPSADFDPRFFFYALQGLDLRAEGYARHFKLLKEQGIPLPPLDEQRRVADVLRSIDNAIVVTQEAFDFVSDLLAAKRRATFRHLIAEPDAASLRFGDICEVGRGFAFRSEDYVDDGVLNFRVTNVDRSLSDLGEQRFLPVQFLDEFKEYILLGEEIVLVMVGATVGKLGRVPPAVCPALLNQNMWTLTARAPFNNDLLWHLSHVLIEEKVHGAQGGAYSFLTKKDFLEYRIGRFDSALMSEQVAYLSAIEAYTTQLALEAEALQSLKRALLADLLSGRVRVPA